MNIDPIDGAEQHENILAQVDNLDEALAQISNIPKRQYTKQEIAEARGNFSLMYDRVFTATFIDNNNNDMLTNWINAMRKIHELGSIPPIVKTKVQQLSLCDILGRGMVGDLLGEAHRLNATVEAQRKPQEGYAIRGTLTSSNAMHNQFNQGDDYTEAPDIIGINLCGFRVPELEKNPMFCARVARFDVDTKEPFLIDKYSDYYIQFPKMQGVKKADLPEQYHELWDMCLLIKAKVKDYDEVIRVNAIANPSALEIADKVRVVVAPDSFVNEALQRKNELEQLQRYMERQNKKREAVGMEKMLVMALQIGVSSEAIETMRKGAGITESRLAELRNQVKMA